MKRLLLWGGVILAAAFSVSPFLWFVSAGFKTETQVTAIPPVLWPSLSFESFRSVIEAHSFFRYMWNSALVAASVTVISIGLGTFAGYALSRMGRRWTRLILMAILACAMFPQIAIVGPIWRFLRLLGWLNTYPGLIMPYVAITLPLTVWILTLFFQDLPAELEAAARVDGCTRLGALFRVVLPLSAPGVFTASVLCFIYAWNEFFLALLIMTDPARQTTPVGIALFQGEHTVPWAEIAAASLITTAPLILLVLLFQRRIVKGLSAGAVTG